MQKGGNRNVGDYFEKAMVWLAVLYSMVLIVSWLFQPSSSTIKQLAIGGQI